jgi:hypothetical protein
VRGFAQWAGSPLIRWTGREEIETMRLFSHLAHLYMSRLKMMMWIELLILLAITVFYVSLAVFVAGYILNQLWKQS